MLSSLWIMRHGLAVDHFESDFTRELSKTGEQQVIDVGLQLKTHNLQQPTEMLVSPFSRTLSTAKIMHKILSIEKAFETDEMLVHFADHKILADFLLASQFTNLLIVSHMPIVASLCQYLVPGCDIYGFKTAQIVKIEFDNSRTHESSDVPVGRIVGQYLSSV
jgi:phosphohistidine phosphatase